ncbi:aldo/keto reductase [Candidatus Pacearchaeota archaeon]|nr:aldo/keto reductase [Candidatus Pacearchaeota archaeon]
MKSKKLPNGFELSVLAIGTNLMGGEDYGPPDYSNDEKYIKAIQDAIKIGYTHIDTAEIYGGGHTEELIGKAIKDFDRKKLFITSKVAKEHLKYDDIINSAKNSLKRLGTDYIDLYLLHRPNPDIPIKETMEAMNYLVDNKIVRYIGVSMFNIEQMQEAQKYSKHPIVTNQLKFSIYKKSDIKTVKYCQENNILVTAYKIFGRGMIKTDKISLISHLSEKYNKTEAQILLKWIISKKNMIAIFKSTNTTHLKENKDIFDFKLTCEEIQKIDALVPSL